MSKAVICDICIEAAAQRLSPRPAESGDDMADIIERWAQVIAVAPQPTISDIATALGMSPRRAVTAIRSLRRLRLVTWNRHSAEVPVVEMRA
jgi:AraC-like DNA-binding protein